MTILITAPTSTIGHIVVDELLEQDTPLRLVTRDASRLSTGVAQRVEVIEGSHGDAATIDSACDGVDAVFWLPPNIDDAATVDDSFAEFTRPAAAAFARHGVARVVGISALGRGTPLADHAGFVTASLAMDDLIADSGVAYRAITCPSLMHNLLNHVGSIRDQGALSMMIAPDLRAPTVAAADVATTAVGLLLDRSWTGVGEVACLGSEDLTPTEQAEIISDVIGTPVRYVQITGEALKARMMGFGFSDAMAQAMVDMFDAKNAGLDNAEPRTPASTTPTTFRQWCTSSLKPALDSLARQ
jgi:uncharacterized protein YbjT (DUF2867 family)